MKHLLKYILMAVLVASVSSCQRELCDGEDFVAVSIDLMSPQVKSVSFDDRDRIERLNVLVFSSATNELIYKDEMRGASIQLYLQKGMPFECFFIVNAPEGTFTEVRTFEDFSLLSSSLIDNKDNHVMQAHLSRSFDSDIDLNVEVSRLCSRVFVGRVTPVFLNSSLAESEIKLKSIFLMNVSEHLSYQCHPADSGDGYQLQAQELYEADYDILIKDKSPVRSDCYLYCYTGDDKDVSDSKTMLVIKLDIGGSPNYYTVKLPRLEPNNEYRIQEVRLLGLGTDQPGILIDRVELLYSVVVNPWGESEDRDYVMN